MGSRSQKGDYYKLKSRDWLKEKGYHVELLEYRMRLLVKGQILFAKRDILGADLVALNDSETILVNSVCGKKNINPHIKEFKKYPKGGELKRWILVWTPRVAEPEIVEV